MIGKTVSGRGRIVRIHVWHTLYNLIYIYVHVRILCGRVGIFPPARPLVVPFARADHNNIVTSFQDVDPAKPRRMCTIRFTIDDNIKCHSFRRRCSAFGDFGFHGDPLHSLKSSVFDFVFVPPPPKMHMLYTYT